MNIIFPPSFLGARGDALMDIVVISMVIILPLLGYEKSSTIRFIKGYS